LSFGKGCEGIETHHLKMSPVRAMKTRWLDTINVDCQRLVIRISGWKFDEDPLKRDEVDGDDLDYGRHNRSFADWRKNSEVALLMVMQKFFTEMNTLGRIQSWQAMWQLKQLFKVGVLEEQRCLLYMGLQSLNGDYTAYLDDNTFKAVYEPRGTYKNDFGELVRFLTRRYFASHGFEGERCIKSFWSFSEIWTLMIWKRDSSRSTRIMIHQDLLWKKCRRLGHEP